MPLIYDKEQALLPLAQGMSDRYNVPVALILAHAKQESAFDPNAYRAEPAIGDASYGLMQVLLRTAKQFIPDIIADQLYDPETNMNVGVAYIAQNLNKYGGNIQDAIAAYNAGTAKKNADGKYVSSSGNTVVQSYVDKVYHNYLMYTNWLGEGATLVDVDYSVLAVVLFIAGGIVWYKWEKS